MRSSRKTEVSLKSATQQHTDSNIDAELSTAWKGLAQSKAALRHIENRIEAVPGTGVCLESVIDSPKKKSSRTVRCRDGQGHEFGASTKSRSRSQQSPEKSSSRSPLRNTTQDSNVRRNNGVEFREPLASYREATPPPHPSAQLEACSLQSMPDSWYTASPPPSNPLSSQLVYQRDTRDQQADKDLDSINSSALEGTEVRYLNDQLALNTLRPEESTPKAQLDMDSQKSSIAPTPGLRHQGESTPSTSPGSASQRLENLRRHQPDDKLEKLKERIRRQRQNLEEAAEREKLLGYQEQPIMAPVESTNKPTVKVRKVATAPPPPVYKGFSSTETKIRTPDGKVWREEEFHNLSREIYRDLSRQFAESTRSRHQQHKEQRADRSKEKRPSKPVRKVHRVTPASDLHAKSVISPASWREGQKLVKMVLGPGPKFPREDQSPSGTPKQTAFRHRSGSDTVQQSRPNNTEGPHRGFPRHSKNHQATTSFPLSAAHDEVPARVSTDILSADIQGILSDLQLDCKAAAEDDRARKRSRGGSSSRRGRGSSGSRTRMPVSAWGTTVAAAGSSRNCRSVSPTTKPSGTTTTGDKRQKMRHYDADTVRQYITRQQEERKRRQVEEKRAVREETEKRNQRLQELYRRQREAAKSEAPVAPVAPVQRRLQETYNKLMFEEAQLGEEVTEVHHAASFGQLKPIYQPSGESDKENKRLEAPQSPSSSDISLNDHLPPPLSRNDLDVGVGSLLQPSHLCPPVQPESTNDHLLSRLLKLEKEVAASNLRSTQRPSTAPSLSKISRIEALKATAASLSNRIESEARKLAGEGINYGTSTSVDGDTVLAPRTSATRATNNNNIALRIQKILTSTGQSSLDDMPLPGTGNLLVSREEKEKNHTPPNLTSQGASYEDAYLPVFNPNTQEKRDLVLIRGKEERMGKVAQKKQNIKGDNRTDLHDSSAGSISEGPLLSEGSLSEDELNPHQAFNCQTSKPVSHRETVEYSKNPRTDYNRLLEFEREAAVCSPFAHTSSKPGWDELNKGSPLSVINIFTKNLHGHIKVSEGKQERNSPAQSLHFEKSPGDAAVYEDDFVSLHSSRASGQLKRGSNSPSVSSHFEELMRRSPYEKRPGDIHSQHSSLHSSNHSPHFSSGSTSGSSPLSKNTLRKRGTTSDQSDGTLVEEQRSSCSPPSESSELRKRGSDKSPAPSRVQSVLMNDPPEQPHQRSRKASPFGSPHMRSPKADSLSDYVKGNFQANLDADTPAQGGLTEIKSSVNLSGEREYSPAVLQQRRAAELQYLESIEDSVRQLGDVERMMGVSMAQQESASLAQMLKAKQQRHEHDLYELKIKAEREALETKLQMEENRQKMATAHIEMQGILAATQRETLEGLQESTAKMMSQQAETARYTADTARHIKELTELACSQITGSLTVPVPTESPMMDQHDKNQSFHANEKQDKADSDSCPSELSSSRTRSEALLSSLNSFSHSDSLSFKRPNLSGATSSSHRSPYHISSDYGEPVEEEMEDKKNGVVKRMPNKESVASSIEEVVATAVNDSLCSESIPSAVEDKGDSTSVATEYSLKFDESMTEDEIEERSFRSLLPSEAHRRGTMEKKSHHEESEDDRSNHMVAGSHSACKETNRAFSGGQDSFSQFTMDMVRQYMKDEEVRLQHQSSLLRLREKAVKEKTRTELAWLEHQKKRLRDKGEDDKMPPIRKKQRGLLMKLQQEQAEIKRLQEANKTARKERQLLLKQQVEIERMRHSTLRLKERLKSGGADVPLDTPVLQLEGSEPASPSVRPADDIQSPSPPLSISGSETSSIMQKLKKMHSHTDEKFLTKREQQLMQRRHHAEELLQWKQRLDQEEAEVRKMEKEALAAWNQKKTKDKDFKMLENEIKDISDIDLQSSHRQNLKARTDSEKEYMSEADCASVTPESSIPTEGAASQQLESPSTVPTETPLASVQSSPANYTQEFTSASQSSPRQSSFKSSRSPAASSDGSNRTKMQLLIGTTQIPNQPHVQPADPPLVAHTDTISDQSDIESRIKALKEELRKRKFMANQLKKEQKKRHKERLKAQEANLLKELENYNNFIEKTKAELNKELDAAPGTNSKIHESGSILEQSRIEPSPNRLDASKIAHSLTQVDASLKDDVLPQQDYSRFTSVPEDFSHEETLTPTVTAYGSKEAPTPAQRSHQSSESPSKPSSKDQKPESVDIEEEVAVRDSSKDDEPSQPLFKLENKDRLVSQERASTLPQRSSSVDKEHQSASVVSPKMDKELKRHETFEVAETSTSNNDVTYQTHSAVPSLSDHYHSPDSVVISSNKQPFINNIEPSPLADGYHDDFESSVDLSPREDGYSSKVESRISVLPAENKGSRTCSQSEALTNGSHEEVIEEEIIEELSNRSVPSNSNHHSERLLNFFKQTEDFKCENRSINSSHSPPVSSIPQSPAKDEMPDFTIGARVLVGGVQPGTLRFKGLTSFANGYWAGVELDKSEGSNNGTYDNVIYFKCAESHGIFAPPDKITHLPDKFELYTDTTEDEDSFLDDFSGKDGDEHKPNDNSQKERDLKTKDEQTNSIDKGTGYKNFDNSLQSSMTPLKSTSHLNSQQPKEPTHSVLNGNVEDIVLELQDTSRSILILDLEKCSLTLQSKKEIPTLVESNNFTRVEQTADIRADKKEEDGDPAASFADKLINNFLRDTVKQFVEIKKAKKQKIEATNQINGDIFGKTAEEEEHWIASVDQKDGLPFFLPEKEELSSPELCNRPQSPVLGAVGQEELAKRLAELELSRELLDDIGDDQDWFDEDFGLSSRREQQRLKQEEEEARVSGGFGRSHTSSVTVMGAMSSSSMVEQQIKIPPRPELPPPLPPKLPEQPAIVVPHSASEVEKMVQVAMQEIWNSCGLGKEGVVSLSHKPKPQPSQDYLGTEAGSQDPEVMSIHSYRKAVYDLTWEILQDIYAGDTNTEQPQWVKPRRVKSSFHRVKTQEDISKLQDLIAAEVLKLYGLAKDPSQKTDWQKMLKFGRKKRDRVDHILVQELHEEEAQWVNYDEDELFVKIQLADSIFDALLKDTVNVLTLISDKRAKQDPFS